MVVLGTKCAEVGNTMYKRHDESNIRRAPMTWMNRHSLVVVKEPGCQLRAMTQNCPDWIRTWTRVLLQSRPLWERRSQLWRYAASQSF